MADYIVTSGELTTVANAIREKNGTSSSLSWPDGFVSGISSGGGGGESDFTKVNVLSVTEDGSHINITLDVLSQNAKNNNYFYLTTAQISTLGLVDVAENTPFILGGIDYDAEYGYYGTAYYCKPDGSVSKLYGTGNENENFIVFTEK